jgi:hypothetical protein
MEDRDKLAKQFARLDHPDDRIVVAWARTLSNWLRLYGLTWADVAHLIVDSDPQIVSNNVDYWRSPSGQQPEPPPKDQWLPHVEAVDRIMKSPVGKLNDVEIGFLHTITGVDDLSPKQLAWLQRLCKRSQVRGPT